MTDKEKIAYLTNRLEGVQAIVNKLRLELETLRGADAMLREIERIIPRNDAHRDYAETIQLALPQRGSDGA